MGDVDDTVSAAMEFRGVINSVSAELFLMPFLVLNTMISFPPTIFFILKTDFFRDYHLTAYSVWRKLKS